MTTYVENPWEALNKLLETISEFGKIAGYKFNMQGKLYVY